MKLTNKLSLPQYLVDWLSNDEYDYSKEDNTISATGLMKPIRVSIITKRHLDNLEMDVSELIASRMGNAIHDSIERIQTPGVSKEIRITRQLKIGNTDYTVTGKYDVLVKEADGTVTIRDIKTTSVWAFIYGGKDADYRTQLSIYRWLLSQTEVVNPVAFIDFFFTDWQSVKARTEDNYPSQRLKPGYKIELLSLEDTEKFIIERLTEFENHKDLPDNDLPECTAKELWADPDTWAVYKIGNTKRATKVCDSSAKADFFKKTHKESSNLTVTHRPGKVKRCKFCPAAPFCDQHAALKAAGQIAW